MKAVQFDRYGGPEVLVIRELPIPEPGAGEVLVKVKAAAINPYEYKFRRGMYQTFSPAKFPASEGTDLAGIVAKVGTGLQTVAAGAEVIGFDNRRASHAEYVIVEASHLTPKPKNVSWEVAGSLAVVGTTAYATVRAVAVKRGDTVAVSGATGGVGSIAIQLAKRAGATVIAIAGAGNQDWLEAHGAIPVAYGQGLADRLSKYAINAFIDAHGDGYVKLAVGLGITRERINTIADFDAIEQYGVKGEGSDAARSASVLAELAALIAAGELDLPIAASFPLDQVRAAFELLEGGHARGKIVLLP